MMTKLATIMRRRWLLLMAAAALLAAWFGGSTLMGQQTPTPDCPEGETCVVLHDWPSFTAIYETDAALSTTYQGVTYTPRVIYRLEWRAMDSWKATVIDSERFDFGEGDIFDMTGSWEEFRGRTYTVYYADTGGGYTSELSQHEFMQPPGYGAFFPHRYSGLDLGARTDGEAVMVETDVCIGNACHEVQDGVTGQSSHASGRKFADEAKIADTTFTESHGRIPLVLAGQATGDDPRMRVLELQVEPTEADADGCQTNLRTVFQSDEVNDQGWDPACTSLNRSGTNAHYYTFTLDESQMVNIQASSPDDDLYIYLMDGAGKAGRVLAQNDNLPSEGGASGTAGSTDPQGSGIEKQLSAGTYTLEVTTSAAGHSTGRFDVGIEGEKPTAVTALSESPTCIQPFPDMKVTNPTLQLKREPFTHLMQRWDPRCMSSHSPTHNAQFYTFVNHDASRVNDEIVLATMRVNIKMTTRHDDVSLLLLGTQLLDGLEPDAPIVATAEPVEGEGGTFRTLEIEKVVPYGAYTIEVRAKNPDGAVFDLTAAHVPDPPAFAQDTYTFSVAEDAAQYASVGTVSATDPEGEAITYRITSGAAGKFDIDANAGIIVVRSGLDYETTPTYTLTVEARNPYDRTGTATVTINVTDVAGT